MNRLLSLLSVLLVATASIGQTRIDSSFAFSTNPAKKYSLYIPSNYNVANPNKMMVAFHPLNTSRWDSESWCDTLIVFAENNNLLLVCPDGGPNGDISDAIDYGFTEALIDSMLLWYNIDTTSIYAMGFSVGGLATYEFGLNHTSIFGGYIPIGAAVNGASAFNSTIGNAECKPFYLVHGSNDSPNIRYTPMLNALDSNCAIVNSNLMSGVGHTIDFPNRNQILSDAYFWIDSVNHAPTSMNYPFGLISPPSFATYVIEGFNNNYIDFKWDESQFAPGCTQYELIIDLPTGNFSSPLYVFPSGNNGSDTSIRFTYNFIDSLITAAGLTVGSTFSFKWAVAVKYYNKFTDTSKSFNLAFTRQKVGFNLVTPSANANQTINKNLSLFFDWTDLRGNDITYDLIFDTVGGDFSNPIMSYVSSNFGDNSLRSVGHNDLYYDLVLPNFQANPGDTVEVIWTARATDSTFVEDAPNIRKLNLIIGDFGFELISPSDKAVAAARAGVTVLFFWDSIPSSNYTYEWSIDTADGSFANPLTTFESNNAGMARRFSANYNILDSIMKVFNIPFGDSLKAWWTVRAYSGAGEYFAKESFEITIFRDFPDGVDEINSSKNNTIDIYPNPASERMFISGSNFDGAVEVSIVTMNGKLVYSKSLEKFENEVSVDVSGIAPGVYFIRLSAAERNVVEKIIIE